MIDYPSSKKKNEIKKYPSFIGKTIGGGRFYYYFFCLDYGRGI
jgi:hypothetical protein